MAAAEVVAAAVVAVVEGMVVEGAVAMTTMVVVVVAESGGRFDISVGSDALDISHIPRNHNSAAVLES
jgi:hypothetical protein